jgi:hypothetical protein
MPGIADSDHFQHISPQLQGFALELPDQRFVCHLILL